MTVPTSMMPLAEQWAPKLLALVALAWLLAGTLRLAWRWLLAQRYEQQQLIELVDAELPQTQCGQCGYAGCRPYAEAIIAGETINRCPPGGEQTIANLARLLNEAAVPLHPAHAQAQAPSLAVIRENECIGCTKCIQACPVDAILGAPKLMHTVIASECTGCDLCVEPCPVDCIDMVVQVQPQPAWELPSRLRQSPTPEPTN